jgi:hypothetical protein
MDILLNLATRLQNDVPMTFSDAMNSPLSFQSFYYQSKAWTARKKQVEYDTQMQMAVIKRLDALIVRRR